MTRPTTEAQLPLPFMSPDTNIAALIAALTSRAAAVRTTADNIVAAYGAQRDAEVHLLERALGVVAPARSALCSRITRARTFLFGTDGESRDCFPQDGLILAGGCQRDGYRNDPNGEYRGRALVVWADGTLSELAYSGRWTRWRGETDNLKCTDYPITPRAALNMFRLSECLTSLARALADYAASGKAADAAQARERAARLTAVAELAY